MDQPPSKILNCIIFRERVCCKNFLLQIKQATKVGVTISKRVDQSKLGVSECFRKKSAVRNWKMGK